MDQELFKYCDKVRVFTSGVILDTYARILELFERSDVDEGKKNVKEEG